MLRTLGAPPRRTLRGRRGKKLTQAEPEPVPTVRATVIRAEPFGSVEEAEQWLGRVRSEAPVRAAEADDALRRVNAAIRAQRAASGDPYVREVSTGQALVLRFGYGAGEELAEGRFTEAWAPAEPRERVKRSMQAPEERFAALIGARDRAAAAEELVLRARLDLDGGHMREAALQARVALEALIAELGPQLSDDQRTALESDRDGVATAASTALRGDVGGADESAVADAVGRMEQALQRLRLGR